MATMHETRKAGLFKRSCLCCGAQFKSEGPYNRMCTQCRVRGYNPNL